jgi:hypothetical protein
VDPRLFESVFSETISPALKYDRIVAVPMPPCPLVAPQDPASSSAAAAASASPAEMEAALALCDHPAWSGAAADKAARLLRRALGDRAGFVRVMPVYSRAAVEAANGRLPEEGTTGAAQRGQTWPAPEPVVWPLRDASPPAPSGLWVCLQVNHYSNSGRLVDRGPAPEDTEAAAAFVALWGQTGAAGSAAGLSELRRFQDGAIVHAVVWDAAKMGGRAHARETIPALIVGHILSRHFNWTDAARRQLGLSAVPAAASSAPQRKGNKAAASAAAVTSEALVTPALPCTVLHAGDKVSLAVAPSLDTTSGGSVGVARFLLHADVASMAPSLALERALDTGGVGAASARVVVAADSSVACSVTPSPISAAVANAAAGEPGMTARRVQQLVQMADPLARGPQAAFANALAACDYLGAALKDAQGLPLKVSLVQPISAQLRYTAPFVPMPHPLLAGDNAAGLLPVDQVKEEADALGDLVASLVPTQKGGIGGSDTVPVDGRSLVAAASAAATSVGQDPAAAQVIAPLEIVITLERSARWPEDADAVAALKAAFYLKMAQALRSSPRMKGVLAATVATQDYLDAHLGGFVFRIYLHHERELFLLEQAAKRSPFASSHAAVLDAARGSSAGAGTASGAPGGMKTVRGFVNIGQANITKGPEEEGGVKDVIVLPNGIEVARRTDLIYAAVNNSRRKGVQFGEMAQEEAAKAAAAKRAAAAAASGLESGADLTELMHLAFGTVIDNARLVNNGTSVRGVSPLLTPSIAGARLDALYLRGVLRTRHAATMHAFATRYPAFAPTVRLTALWLSALGAGPEASGLASQAAVASSAAGALPSLAVSDPASAVAVVAGHTRLLQATADDCFGRGAHVPQEAIELLVAHVFSDRCSAFARAPATPTVAFLRLLRLLSRFNWRADPLLVDVNVEDGEDEEADELSRARRQAAKTNAVQVARIHPSDHTALHAKFQAARARGGRSGSFKGRGGSNASTAVSTLYPPKNATQSSPTGAPLYIVTAAERGPWRPVWTQQAPSWPVLDRLVEAAKATEAALAAAIAPVAATTVATSAPTTAPCRRALAHVYNPGSTLSDLSGLSGAAGAVDVTPATQMLLAAFLPNAGGAKAVTKALMLPDAVSATAALTGGRAGFLSDLGVHGELDLDKALVPRLAMDGRSCGPVRPPVLSALSVAALPLLAVQSIGRAVAVASRPKPQSLENAAHAEADLQPAVVSKSGIVLVPKGAKRNAVLEEEDSALQRGEKATVVSIASTENPLEILQSGSADGSQFSLPLFKNLLRQSKEAVLVGLDPIACFLKSLRSPAAFGDSAWFFALPAQGKVYVAWKPEALDLALVGYRASADEAGTEGQELLALASTGMASAYCAMASDVLAAISSFAPELVTATTLLH